MSAYALANTSRAPTPQNRSGTVLVFTAFTLVILVSCVAFALDLGYLNVARTELQCSADAAVLAAAWELLDQHRLAGGADMTEELAAARAVAIQYAALNRAVGASPVLDSNLENDPDGDIVFGHLANPEDLNEPLSFVDPNLYNTVVVRVRRTESRNGPVPLFFARALGFNSVPVMAEATATFEDGVTGFRVTTQSGNASLLPFTVRISDWLALLAGVGPDNWSYDPNTHTVFAGPDGIRELRMFPDVGVGQIGVVPGNFGTVDIGSSNNSNADLRRQIQYGVSADDLVWHGGELRLDPSTGILVLNGDTGVDSSIQLAMDSIVGQPRTITLYTLVTGQGNTASFTISGFAGVRVVDYNLSGSLTNKHVTIQPAFVVDNAAITDGGPQTSYFVYEPARLTR